VAGLIFADSSGLIARFLEKDPNHAAAIGEMDRLVLEGRRFLTTNYIFDEVVTRVRRLAGFPWSRKVGDALLSSSLIRRVYLDQADEARAWDLYLKHQDLDLSFTDATSIGVMRRYRLEEAFTFDRDFSRAGFTVLPR